MDKEELQKLEDLLYKLGELSEEGGFKMPEYYFQTCELVSRELDERYKEESGDLELVHNSNID